MTAGADVRLPRAVLAAYAAPAFSQALIHGPVGAVIQGIYGTHFGLPLASIAFVLVLSRVFDAVTDPLIGYLSDRFPTRWGRRKPWLVAGSLLAVIACWFLYVPPGKVSTGSFLFWILLAYLGWTLSEIPYRAWLAELSQDYHERTRIATWRTFARFAGFMAFYGIPFLPWFETSEFTPETLHVTAILAAVALPTTALIAAPCGRVCLSTETPSLRAAWPALIGNRPLLLFLATFALGGLSGGCVSGMMFFFVGGHLGVPGALALLFVLGTPLGALMMPVWTALSRRIGKARTWAIAYGLAPVFLLLHLLVPAGEAGQPVLIALSLGIFALSSVGVVVPAAMLADITDYGRWKFGRDFTATYSSVQTMVEKGVEGFGIALALGVAGALGFDPRQGTQESSGTIGLLIAFPVLPALLSLACVPLILRMPIDERAQRAIVARLARRQPAVHSPR
jgi:Na+/melibiose symporter-like transporter